ncbi:MAG TPA: WG repeat-containing protein [Agriterribacter sp.]|nr:WG repeat-containing protein [Agriterribacter sp.]
MFAAQLPAQTTKTGKKIREARETIEEIGNVVDDIFSTKKKNKKAVEDAGKENTGKADNEMENPQPGNAKNTSGLQPGDVHPDARVIDADILFPFNKGAAVVQKGTAFGLINKKGDFIVPYNKYSFNQSFLMDGKTGAWSQGGIFIVGSPVHGTGSWVINYEGKLITGEYPSLGWFLTNNRLMAYTQDKNENIIFMNAEGQKHILKHNPDYSIRPETYSEDAVVVWANNSKGGAGFKNMKDEWIVKPKYDLVEPFSEGLARVTKENEFGELKYGYINKEGKEVIGLIFSRGLDDFKGGLAKVYPKDRTEFVEAYIDKKGNVVAKLDKAYKYLGDGLYLESSKRRNILNAEGKIIPANEFLKTYGVVLNTSTDKELDIIDWLGVSKQNYIGKIRFVRELKQSGVASYGFVNLETKKVVEGRFVGSGNAFVFDPVSKLGTAQFYINKDMGHKSPLREGYINEDGVFMIIKGEKSKW